MSDRRVDARFPPPAPSRQATLRPGCSVALVDVSAGGALVEASRPIRPGARVHLQVSTPARRYTIAAHVLRCAVSALDPVDGVTYRGALKFEQPIEWCWAEQTHRGHKLPDPATPPGLRSGQLLPDFAAGDERNARKVRNAG